jgi:hypothetical protein
MREIEVLVADAKDELIVCFRSIRSAYDFVIDCIDRESPYLLVSRPYILKNISNYWFLIAADARRKKLFLLRYKQNSTPYEAHKT